MKKTITIKEAGSRGGKARAKNMSRKQRTKSARLAANARWGNKNG